MLKHTIFDYAGKWRRVFSARCFFFFFACASRKFSFSRSRTGYLISLLYTRGCREDGNEGFLGEKEKKFNYGWTENPENCFCKRNWSAKNSVRTEKSLKRVRMRSKMRTNSYHMSFAWLSWLIAKDDGVESFAARSQHATRPCTAIHPINFNFASRCSVNFSLLWLPVPYDY